MKKATIYGFSLSHAEIIAEAAKVKADTSIKSLEVMFLPFSHDTATAFADMIQGNTALEILTFQYCNIKDAKETAVFANALTVNTTLKELNLKLCDITNDGVVSIVESLKKNPMSSLVVLNLERNYIGSDGIKKIANLLADNRLTHLDISHNMVDPNRIEYISKALETNTSLKVLNLSGNDIKDNDTAYLADALKINTTLTILYLESCDITRDGAKNLADALAVNQGLFSINLSRNPIGDQGIRYIANALKSNNHLSCINVSDTGISSVASFLDALDYNTHLIILECANLTHTPEYKMLHQKFVRNGKRRNHAQEITSRMVIAMAFVRANRKNELKYLGLQQLVQAPIIDMAFPKRFPSDELKSFLGNMSAFSKSRYFKEHVL
jgi:Ran GTPase-activating protein (RanGAP) involved in mRNA processing and transport